MSGESAGDLRRHAEHCRKMAHHFAEGRTRTILLTMADELDGQAEELDIRARPGWITPL
jgi:hypothetical protein